MYTCMCMHIIYIYPHAQRLSLMLCDGILTDLLFPDLVQSLGRILISTLESKTFHVFIA